MPWVASASVRPGISCAPQHGRRTREFDRVVPRRAGRTVARTVRPDEVQPTLKAVSAAISGMVAASEQVVTRVLAKNPESFWVFVRDGQLLGCSALLMLNTAGLAALLADEMDILDPATGFLTPAGERPAAIYIWALASPGYAADGIAKVIMRLQAPPYDRSDIYASPATEQGLRFLRSLGFEPIPGHPRNLFQYVRLANRTPGEV